MDNYWTRASSARVGRRRLLQGMGAAGAGSAAWALAGCGDDDAPKATKTVATGGTTAPATSVAGSPSAAASPTATATPQNFLASIPLDPPDPTPVAQFKSGGSIVRLTDRPLQIDFPGGGGSNVGDVILGVYSRLIRFSNRAGMKSIMNADLEGDLATSWEQPDDTTIVFNVTPGVKYSEGAPLNGRAMTFDDIKYSFTRMANHPRAFAGQTDARRIKSLEDVGGGKVKMTLVAPFVPFMQLLGGNYWIIQPPEVAPEKDVSQKAQGSGPFMITSLTPNVEVVYKKNPTYFKKDSAGKQLPYLDGYTLSSVADIATRLATVEAGKADSSYQQSTPVTFDNAEDLNKRYPGKFVFQAHGQHAPFFYITGHLNKPPWNDVRVRRAFNMILDREKIMKSLHSGLSHVGPYMPWTAIFDKEPKVADLGPNYKYDPKAAKEMLAAAGITNGEFTLDWYESGTNAAIVQIFQQAAAEIGVKINLVKSPDLPTHLTGKVYNKSWKDLVVLARGASYPDVEAVAAGFDSARPDNYADVADAELDKLYAQVKTAKGEARKAIHKQMWDRMLDQVIDVPFPQKYDLVWWTSRLHNWRSTAAYGNVGSGNPDQMWVSS